MGFCLTPKTANEFKEKILNGTIDPEKVSSMSSKDRRSFFAEHFGEDIAEPVNRLFESKLILKHQQQGMISWANKLLGVSPEAKRDIISRIQRMDKVLEPHDEQSFLEDLAAAKLGTRVSYEEAQNINELANKVDENESKKGDADFDTRMEYGRSVVELTNYVGDLKKNNNPSFLQELRTSPGGALLKVGVNAPGFFKSIQASFDNSALLRQGWKNLFAHPIIWQKNARKTFVDLAQSFGGKNVTSELQADIVSRPNYDLYKKAKLNIGLMDEAYPSSLPEKIPGLGRAFKASQDSFTNFVHKTNADVFDAYMKIGEKQGREFGDTDLINIGRMVNSLTGRGHLGKFEPAADALNVVFFAPRNLKSHIDVLGGHAVTGGATLSEIAAGTNTGSDFVRRQSALNALKIIGGTALVLGIANAVAPNSVDLDPRSADFGKIKIGNTRIDVSGGMANIITLAARIITNESKSSVTGKISKLNETDSSGNPKFGAKTKLDLVEDFLENKLSPVGGEILNSLKGETREGGRAFSPTNPTTYLETAGRLVTPLPAKNTMELLSDPNAAPLLVALIADGLGAAANTYGKPTLTDQNISPDAREAQLKLKKIPDIMDLIEQADEQGEDSTKFKEALEEKLDRKYDRGQLTDAEAERANKILKTDEYEGQTDDPPPPTFNKYNKNADSVIEKISAWARAAKTDPLDAFDKFFKGESIARMENGTIVVERMSLQASEAERKRLGGGGKQVKLDHFYPLELGGTNAKTNLRLVTTDEWESYTPIENYLAGALHDGKIDGKQAKELIQGFKNGFLSKEDVVKKVGEPFEE